MNQTITIIQEELEEPLEQIRNITEPLFEAIGTFNILVRKILDAWPILRNRLEKNCEFE